MIWNPFVTVAACLAYVLQALGAPVLDASLVSRQAASKYVFAHFMVGIVENYKLADWVEDMNIAKSIGIDGFALNCASIDSYTPTQLELAYQAAQQVDFKVFISFDFAYWSNGDTAKITEYMNKYAAHPAQVQYGGGALVSTFVGDSFNWGPVKQGTSHPIHSVPHLQDPAAVPNNPSKSVDAVSPWFSTHFNTKNWVFICENLPTLRWEQMLKLKPSLVEIVSWNDYGESHYIGPYAPNHKDDGSSQWAKDMPHDAWRNLYKPYIAAYKSGASAPTIDKEEIVYWYRPTPKGVTCTGDNLGAPNGKDMLSDSIFVATMLKSPATLTVTSGSTAPVNIEVPAGIVTSNVTMGVGAQSFSVQRNGQMILSGQGGRAVKDECTHYNFNVFVGSVSGSGSSTGESPSSPSSSAAIPSSTP
ncbi:hypothetical protein BBP40_006357 [Aspergillus hancockii]|nr:hypothetical protein BBP40_006357 [Aspergillus hancockii]